MKLIKGKRPAFWIRLHDTTAKQTRRGKGGSTFAFVTFLGTKSEVAMAKRLGRPSPWHYAWVNLSSLEEHGGI